MSLITALIAFAKADAEKKGIPVLIQFLQDLVSAKTALDRATALAKFLGGAEAMGTVIAQDILADLSTALQAELTTIQTGGTAAA